MKRTILLTAAILCAAGTRAQEAYDLLIPEPETPVALRPVEGGRIYRTEVVREPGVVTAAGDEYRWLKAWAYLMRTEKNQDLIMEIEGGIKREGSVGCAVKRAVCSICGADRRQGGCGHEKGEEYGGRLCVVSLEEAEDAFEFSFVAVPAQREAGVVKGAAALQKLAEGGNPYALAIFDSIGVYLAHTLSLYEMFYDIRNLLALGRVASGIGGERIVSECQRVLNEEYPELSRKLRVMLPDENFRRVGQSMAAASLPDIR